MEFKFQYKRLSFALKSGLEKINHHEEEDFNKAKAAVAKHALDKVSLGLNKMNIGTKYFDLITDEVLKPVRDLEVQPEKINVLQAVAILFEEDDFDWADV
jgi:hypothetical protein